MYNNIPNNNNDQHVGTWMEPGNFFGVPVDQDAKDMNPWRKSLLQILLGIALFTVSIDYLMLDVLMPFAGALLMYLGFRTLRDENPWFLAGNILAGAEMIWAVAELFLVSTALRLSWHQSVFYEICRWGIRGAQLGLLLCLRQGIRAVQVKAERIPKLGAATTVMVLYAAAVLLTVPNDSAVLGYTRIGVYALLLWTLYGLSGALDGAGYGLYSTPISFSDPVLSMLFVGLAAASVIAGTLFLSKYPMRWTAQQQSTNEAYVQSYEKLEAEGVSDGVLRDLSEADILACGGASLEGQDVYTLRNNGLQMEVTTFWLRLPGDSVRYKVVHHFAWETVIDHTATESLIVQLNEQLLESAENLSGQVLCNQDGQRMQAKLAGICKQVYQNQASQGTKYAIFANLSLPKNARGARGYVSYELAVPQSLTDSLNAVLSSRSVTYLFQTVRPKVVQFPFVGTQEYEITKGYYTRNDTYAKLSVKEYAP